MDMHTHRETGPYGLFMLALCISALVALGVGTIADLDVETRAILEYFDILVCAIFFVDFIVSLARASDRWRYLFTWGWVDLLSSIPTVDILRAGRAARILRVLRVLRGVRATKLVASLILERRKESAFLAASLVSLVLVTFASIAVLQFEAGNDANIKDAGDAVWWAFATITTVGYGDRFPVTSEGRLVGALLMTAGVGLFGVFSGFVAAWFLGAAEQKQTTELEELRSEIKAIRALLERAGQ